MLVLLLTYVYLLTLANESSVGIISVTCGCYRALT